MSKIEYRVCDRCGDKINPHHKKESKITVPKRIKIISRLFQFMSENTVELCGECTEELENFLYSHKTEKKEIPPPL